MTVDVSNHEAGMCCVSCVRRRVSAIRGIAARKLIETFIKRKLAKRSRRGLDEAISGREKGSRSGGRILIHASTRGMGAPSKRIIMKNAARRAFNWPKEGRMSNTVSVKR